MNKPIILGSDDLKELDYEEMQEKIIAKIADRRDIVLATCDKKRVTARTIYCISDKFDIYFLTSKAYLKYKQIEKNSNVALCFDNVQIEGIAENLGHPSQVDNESIMKKAETHKQFMEFVKYKNTVLIKIKITRVEMWEKNHRLYLEVDERKSYIV